MFAHAIRSTMAVMPRRSASGVLTSSCMELCPRIPGSTRSSFVLNRSIVCSVIEPCNGTSISFTIAE